MSCAKPCDTCHKSSACNFGHGCEAWRKWFFAEWEKFNNFAVAHGLKIEKLKGTLKK